MTGEQRSADGWQENREKGKRGVRVEDGDFFFFWGWWGGRHFQGDFGGEASGEKETQVSFLMFGFPTFMSFLLWYLGIKETLFYRLNMSCGVILVFLLWNLISPVLACC